MKEEESTDVVEGAELFVNIVAELIKKSRRLGATPDDIRNLGRPIGDRILEEAAKLIPQGLSRPLHAKVNYDGTIRGITAECRLKVTGDQPPDDKDLNSGSGVVNREFYLVHRGYPEGPTGIFDHMETNGLRPATYRELAFFARSNRKLAARHQIMALGDGWLSLVSDNPTQLPAATMSQGQNVNIAPSPLSGGPMWGQSIRYLAVRGWHRLHPNGIPR
jgi:hypothetical protein